MFFWRIGQTAAILFNKDLNLLAFSVLDRRGVDDYVVLQHTFFRLFSSLKFGTVSQSNHFLSTYEGLFPSTIMSTNEDTTTVPTSEGSSANNNAILASSSSSSLSNVTALCFGTGRFLRSVLVPALIQAEHSVALIQPRGTSMKEYLLQRQRERQSSGTTTSTSPFTYEVDTVQPDGSITTEEIPIAGCFSMGNPKGQEEFLLHALPKMTKGYVSMSVCVCVVV